MYRVRLASETSRQCILRRQGNGDWEFISRRVAVSEDSWNQNASLRQEVYLGGALVGKPNLLCCVGPNPAAGENRLHFSISEHF